MTLKHQYHGNGSHRIVELDVAGFLKESGEWVGYQNLATIERANIVYMAATEYYAGTLEPNTIYQLFKTGFKSETYTQK